VAVPEVTPPASITDLDATPDADSYSGQTVTLTAHENVTLGSVGFVNSDGEGAKADKDAAATAPALYMATAAISADAAGVWLRSGIIHLHTLAPSWTPGGLVFLGDDGGMVQDVSGYATGDQVQVLGVALAADILDFNPSLDLFEVA
jgi:hypothetical protein